VKTAGKSIELALRVPVESCPHLRRTDGAGTCGDTFQPWRERPRLVAAGEIAETVRSRGRSRHGQLVGTAMTVAKSSGRQTDADRMVGARKRNRTSSCSGRPSRENTRCLESEWQPPFAERGEHPASGPVPLRIPPGQTLSRGYYGRGGRGDRTGPAEQAWQ
jgi:hypothetical protein